MDTSDIASTTKSLDTITDEYVLEETTNPFLDAFEISLRPLTVRRGEVNGDNQYIIDEVAFEDERVLELYRENQDTVVRPLRFSVVFEEVSDEQAPTEESYIETRDAGIQSCITTWEDDENMVISERDIDCVKTLVDREFLQANALTAPLTDSAVDELRVYLDRVIVTVDGDEYIVNIPVSPDSVRRDIIQFAQGFGEHISAADKSVELTDIPAETHMPRQPEFVSVYLPEPDEQWTDPVIKVCF